MQSALALFAQPRETSGGTYERIIYASIALIAACVIPVVLLSHAIGDGRADSARITLCAVSLVSACLSLFLTKTGYRRYARLTTLTTIWLAATFFAFYTGIGLHSSVIFLYLPSILFTSLLCGIGPAAIQTVLTIAAIGTLVWAEDSGQIGGVRAFIENTTNFNFALGVSVSCFAILVVASVYQRAVKTAVRQLRESRRALEAAHAEVTALNADLENRVAARTRELEETVGDLESFNYTIAHDLRTPLRALNGYASTLLENCADKLDAEDSRMLERIASAALRLDSLQSALLELGRIGVRPFDRKRVNLAAVAQSVIGSLRSTDISAGTRFLVPESLYADGDPILAFALLKYLLENAVKFSAHKKEPVVEFGQKATERGSAFFVRDNGIGFKPEYVSNLFQPFYKIHTDRDDEGIGIGLACARRIVERHHGSLWAESEENRGATFYFTLSPPLDG